MNIRLIQSGGQTGVKMQADLEIGLSLSDWNDLLEKIRKTDGSRKAKDGFLYSIQRDEDEHTMTPIDIQSIPEKYDDLFEQLFDRLKISQQVI